MKVIKNKVALCLVPLNSNKCFRMPHCLITCFEKELLAVGTFSFNEEILCGKDPYVKLPKRVVLPAL